MRFQSKNILRTIFGDVNTEMVCVLVSSHVGTLSRETKKKKKKKKKKTSRNSSSNLIQERRKH